MINYINFIVKYDIKVSNYHSRKKYQAKMSN